MEKLSHVSLENSIGILSKILTIFFQDSVENSLRISIYKDSVYNHSYSSVRNPVGI